MIKRHESRPETVGTCLARDNNDKRELESLIDYAIRKYETGDDLVTRKIVLQIDKFSIRAVESIADMYRAHGWGVRVASSSSSMFTLTELHIQW